MKTAVYTGTRNLYPHMIPAVKSLLINSDVEKIYLLIEDDEFPFYLPEEVECINVSDQKFFKPDSPNMSSGFTYMAMMRAALCYIFPDQDRILSLDVDTIAIDDVSDIWNLPIDDYYFAAVKEPRRCIYRNFYTNIGVALYNLSKLREDGKADEAIELLNTRKCDYLEQDAFNKLCRGKIYCMPSEYNVNYYTGNPRKRKIMHYAHDKQWDDKPDYIKYAAIPWEDIRKGEHRL